MRAPPMKRLRAMSSNPDWVDAINYESRRNRRTLQVLVWHAFQPLLMIPDHAF
jgi:hypothetical protein